MRLRKAVGPATIILISTLATIVSAAPPLSPVVGDRVGTQSVDSKPAAQPESKSNAANPLDDIAWMKGGTWVAEVKDKEGNVATRIETRIRGSENGHLNKFTTTFIERNRPHLQYEGVYLYDPANKWIAFYYTDSEGNFTRGHAAFANGTLTQDFEIVHANGQADTLRSLVVRDGENAYNWNVMSKKSGDWAEIFRLRYVREKSGD